MKQKLTQNDIQLFRNKNFRNKKEIIKLTTARFCTSTNCDIYSNLLWNNQEINA